jgi:anaerobic ribonucleoside-triphosphate reductase activating protein
MEIRLAAPLTFDSIVDGPGLRTVVWTQGCPHLCLGCHNPHTHDFSGGILTTTKAVISQIENIHMQKGITLSGGEPFEQATACFEIASYCKKRGWDVWVYTGYTYEYLLTQNHEDWRLFLSAVDILIDGPFILSVKDLSLPFRGSRNQRLIDVKASMDMGSVIFWNKND